MHAATRAYRIDVVQALRGARRPPRQNRRRPLIGLILLILGIAVTLAGGALLVTVTQNHGTTALLSWALSGSLIGGPILAVLGLVLCSQLVLNSVARALGRSGVAARLATRDAARHPTRSVRPSPSSSPPFSSRSSG